ncbi:MAG: hypothetical protein ACREBW_06825, partial [Candidatus Micrarchaeaceae archaeon]
ANAPIFRNPGPEAVRPARRHIVTRSAEFIAVDWSGRVAIGEDAVDPAHGSVNPPNNAYARSQFLLFS